jgi:hypothetical protein
MSIPSSRWAARSNSSGASASRLVELGGDVLIVIGRSLRQMPGPSVRILLRVGHGGQRRVQLLPFAQRRRAVGRRAGQRMAEPDPAAELDQSRLHGRRARPGTDAQAAGRPPQQRPVAGRIGRGQLQQPAGLGGQGVQLAGEAGLDPAGQRRDSGQAEPAGQLGRGQAAREFQQRQRVAPGLGDDQVADPRVQRSGQGRVQ